MGRLPCQCLWQKEHLEALNSEGEVDHLSWQHYPTGNGLLATLVYF